MSKEKASPVVLQPYVITVKADGYEVSSFTTTLPKGSGGELLVAVQDKCREIIERNAVAE